ncbi:transcriptional repressor general negative regulator of transcription subunit 4 [Marasmius crinis-equi]|uniref:Transcriptional repressor general negative regulator of transcription subunit 4 n=1 Tax=Marasmius crinis-equi TaxID=585013 RepID=A0ABR3FH96_9AGAR
MSTTRIHHALPAPVVHQGFSVHQSKSHVLAGVQDAYWSDDEAEDAECPLCLEEMDISDLNFKPCVCGYQVCRFCWHHIKENLNKRCPACRRVYTDDAVEFKPIATQDHKRLTQQKKQRERERKELETLGRKHLANVRVVQRNVVYVVGIGPRFAKEELIPTLRSHEYFGQYGKINKILLVKRNSAGGGSPVLGVYITYHRREDAARAIAAVDGSPSPSGGREVMRASYGTTKYCMSFLRSVSCSDHNCMNLHEWGDEKDCFTKEDLTTLKHTMKATESRTRTVVASKSEAEGLPKAAAWGHRSSAVTPANNSSSSSLAGSATSRRRGVAPAPRQTRPVIESRPSNGRAQERKAATTAAKPPSQASSSRPATPAPASLPARPASPSVKAVKSPKLPKKPPVKEVVDVPSSSQSPAPSATAGSDQGSQDATPVSPQTRPQSASPAPSSIPSVPPGLPAVPPGLSAPPGLPAPRPPRVDTASPQTPLLASQTTYQMSTAARALLDDVKARRELLLPSVPVQSPFPDFDRTLQNLTAGDSEFGGFTFNLDPKLANSEDASEEPLPDLEVEAATPFIGNFMQAFPALRTTGMAQSSSYASPPGIPYPHNPSQSIYDPMSVRSTPIENQSTGSSNYIGSFNPFADNAEEVPRSGSPSPTKSGALDDDPSRRVSRFQFARGGRQTTSRTHTSSPLHISSSVTGHSASESANSLYHPSPVPHSPAPSQWSLHSRQEYPYQQTSSAMASPLVSHSQPPGLYPQQQSRFQPFDNNVSGVTEVQLREFIQSSRVNANPSREGPPYKMASGQQGFVDPAIMSARFSTGQEPPYLPLDQSYGPPPGLSFPEGMQHGVGMTGNLLSVSDGNGHNHESLLPTETTDTPPLDPSDFPALSSTIATEPTPPSEDKQTTLDATLSPEDLKAKEKAERKAAKKAANAEKAAERQRIAQEKAAIKAAEKAKVAQEKAAEKEKAAALKAQQEKEKAEKERIEKEKAKAERLAKAEREKAAQAEREKAAQAEREKAARLEKEKAEKAAKKAAATATKASEAQKTPGKKPSQPAPSKVVSATPEVTTQVPLLSKKPKKNKPIAKPIKVPTKEDDHVQEDTSTIPSASASDAHPTAKSNTGSSNNSRSQSVERSIPTSLADLLEEIHVMNPMMDLIDHPFFDVHKINPAAKMPLEYGPLVHALSALSVGGGSFANNVPSGSIDNAVSSFQQLLETLTQTISDLLRLLPRTTWDDSSSFDGVLRDMLKGDDFLDDNGEDGQTREDEVAALTLALERRARWMEVQLSKLEELHRDINNAAVRAVLAFNDSGWDRHGFMPRVGNTVRRFDKIGIVGGEESPARPMSVDELEKKLAVAKEAAVFAETELREMMEVMQAVKPVEEP